MADFGSIFLGMTPSPFRPWLKQTFKQTLKKYPKLIVPAVGNFTVPLLAVEAGYPPSAIYTSDISAYTTLVASYLNEHYVPIPPELTIEASDEDWKRIGNLVAEDQDMIPAILLLMKCQQLKDHVYHEHTWREEYLNNPRKYIDQFRHKLDQWRDKLNGINYKIQDMREVLSETKHQGDSVIYLNAPGFSKGYTKMYDFQAIHWNSGIDEFDIKKEIDPWWETY